MSGEALLATPARPYMNHLTDPPKKERPSISVSTDAFVHVIFRPGFSLRTCRATMGRLSGSFLVTGGRWRAYIRAR